MRIRTLEISAIVVSAIFSVPVWHNVLTYDVAVLPVEASTVVPVIIKTPLNALPVAIDKALLPKVVSMTIAAPKLIVKKDLPPIAPLVGSAGIGVPVRINIPSIGLDAAIEQLGKTTDGAMAVPTKPLDASWYRLGPRPGEVGSATIAGHVDWVNGGIAVFGKLHEIRQGDIIRVKDDNGVAISFVVREIRIYDATADATDIFSSTDGKIRLNIITCYGVWDKTTNDYSQRLVVFAEKGTE